MCSPSCQKEERRTRQLVAVARARAHDANAMPQGLRWNIFRSPVVGYSFERSIHMPRGSKSSYSSKQKRRAEHIEESYEKRGTGSKEAARRARASVNKEPGG